MKPDASLFESYEFQSVSYLSQLSQFGTPADLNGLTDEAKKRFMPCAEYVAQELKKIGLEDVVLTEEGYIYATIPATTDEDVPVIALMAHYDTALENPGEGTEAILHENYQGGDLSLPNNAVVIPEAELVEKIGHDIITGDGKNQLGADDKAGVATIIDVARFLTEHSDIPHGKVRIIINNNEEVGRGIEFLNYDTLGADFAYCVDDGEVGNLFEENFNAESVTVSIEGVTEHPGYAKGKMVNALNIANELVNILDSQFKGPEQTELREPYLGLNAITGTWTKADVKYVLRGFDTADIDLMQASIEAAINHLSQKYPKANLTQTWDQIYRYENSGEILKKHPKVNELAQKAYRAVGLEPHMKKVRGGFDGVKMSFDGLPTSDVFSAAYNMHGLNEWSTRQDLELTVKMLVNLLYLWSQE